MQSRTLLLGLSLVFPLCGAATAQGTPGPDGRTIVPRDTSDADRHKTLFTYRDAALAAGFAALTVAMFPADRHIAQTLQDEDVKANKFFDKAGKGVEAITTPGAFIIGGGLYAAGKLTSHPDLADLGWHGTEAFCWRQASRESSRECSVAPARSSRTTQFPTTSGS
jgi:hypothetical protein